MNKAIFIEVKLKAIDCTTDSIVCYTQLTKETELKQEQTAKLFGVLAEEIGAKIETVNKNYISINKLTEIANERYTDNE